MRTGWVVRLVGSSAVIALTIAIVALQPAHADLCSNGIPSTPAANLDDFQTARDIALGTAPLSQCPGLNANGDQNITVPEILSGISLSFTSALSGDGGGATGLFDPVFLDVGTAWGSAGEEVTFDVRLKSGLTPVAGAQIDITFDPQTVIEPHPNPLNGGAPFCDVNPSINKGQSAFAFQGSNKIRALIVSFTNIDIIPDNSVLFTCHVKIGASAPTGAYPLPCSNALTSTPAGIPLPTSCTPGEVAVIAPTVLDHYKCYQGSDLKNPKFTKLMVDTSDQFDDDAPAQALKLMYVCTPVDKNGEGVANPAAHLACYGIKASALPSEPRTLVSTQFQASQFQLLKPKLLCLPATKTLMP